MNHFKVSLVIHGQTEVDPDVDGRDPYEVPKGLNKFQQIDSGNPLSTQDIITRIIDNRFVERIVFRLNIRSVFSFSLLYEKRNKKKEAKEAAAYEAFKKLQEDNLHETAAVHVSAHYD